MKFAIYCDADFNPLVENYNKVSNEYNEWISEFDYPSYRATGCSQYFYAEYDD